mmetsp:Transcript_2125/g.13863  ORF Transcript_2125/g.13863 Transcript_2125/m.13863 type:complete len:191 (+) Transcript_2125:29-601(+)
MPCRIHIPVFFPTWTGDDEDRTKRRSTTIDTPIPTPGKGRRSMDPHENLADEIRKLESDIRKQGDVVRAKKAQKKDGLVEQVRRGNHTPDAKRSTRRNGTKPTRNTSEQRPRRSTITQHRPMWTQSSRSKTCRMKHRPHSRAEVDRHRLHQQGRSNPGYDETTAAVHDTSTQRRDAVIRTQSWKTVPCIR